MSRALMLFGTSAIGFIARWLLKLPKRKKGQSDEKTHSKYHLSRNGESGIDHITNGVHIPTWIEPKMQLLLNKHLGSGWIADHDNPLIWELIDKIPDEKLWKTHYWLKIKLIDAIRERSRLRWVEDRVNPSLVVAGGTLLDPSVFTLGFARRFATYKRADLIFNDLDRLKRILNDRWRPIQFIFAGKAHPADDPGKRIMQRISIPPETPTWEGALLLWKTMVNNWPNT
jgi:starch phosphorylase